MKLYEQGVARRLHEQRRSQAAHAGARPQAAGAPRRPEAPALPDRPQNTTGDRKESSPRVFRREAQPSNFPSHGAEHEKRSPHFDGLSATSGRGETNDASLPNQPKFGQIWTNLDKTFDSSASPDNPSSRCDPAVDEPIGRPQPVRRVAHRLKPLSPVHLNAIDLLVMGHTDTSVAEKVGVHRHTIANWSQLHPQFRAELARRRAEIWSAAGDKFRAGLEKAVETLQEQASDVYAPTAFRAARAMLALAPKFRPADEPVDVEGVLNLEARKLKVQKQESHPGESLVYEDEREEALQFLMKKAGEDFTLPPDAQAKSEANSERPG